ncbi:polysaccharide lyase 6 family protein [Lentzea flaviverrucosa]|uniref:Chondroitinase B n=1 Tax=Lentzea flaviverrucosa TaxID=200379 RepID=A0A1H9XNX3_9PSEU|nr:polysaccharide lyase 6 family protein [Lentzea flaviverrucosa]RDI19648.1 chondroitinase B-like protein [Lentzea flaviverrucosa]SES47699.1 Chondroitinase B [Lentzea flaviverrucosa]
MIRSLAAVGAAALLSSLVQVPAFAAVVGVSDVSSLQAALDTARPGQRIVLADGVHAPAEPIKITTPGVTVAAKNVGRTVFTRGGFELGAVRDVTIEGFVFNGSSTLSVPVEAQATRITRNTYNGNKDGASLSVSADDVQIDHNTFSNRSNEGVYLQITGPGSEIAKRTWVHHNYFYNHSFTGANGGESIRLGYSHKQSKSAYAVIEHNLFEKANGDPEAISVKASDNTVRFNTIRDSKGYIVLRHGNRTTVEGNLLFGSGIRFHGNDHKVFNNYVQNTGDRAIVFGKGSETDSGPSSTSHDRPDRVTVAFNTLVGTGAVVDSDTGTYAPKDCVLANNVIQGSSSKLIDMMSGSTVKYEGNIVWGGTAGIPSGYRSVDPKLVRDSNGLLRLASGSPAVDTSAGTYSYVTRDFDLQSRSGKPDVGADEYNSSAVRKPLTKADVGVSAP